MFKAKKISYLIFALMISGLAIAGCTNANKNNIINSDSDKDININSEIEYLDDQSDKINSNDFNTNDLSDVNADENANIDNEIKELDAEANSINNNDFNSNDLSIYD